MGRKSKAIENGLVELIVSKSDGGKNTIVYVTDEVNRYLEANGLKVRFSRESIRRVIKTNEEEIADAKRSIEAAKAMAAVFRDNPGTEVAEAALMTMSGLIAKEIRSVESIEFESAESMAGAAAKVAVAQAKLADNRLKAVSALEKAKTKLKEELKTAIQSDSELLEKLCAIVDKAEVR